MATVALISSTIIPMNPALIVAGNPRIKLSTLTQSVQKAH
jgi:hypothetical protein